MDPHDAWLATLGQLEIQLNRATYETWVAGAEFVAYEGDTFTVSVRNAYAKDWLEQRLYRLVQTSLSTVLREEVQVRFVVQQPVPRRRFTRLDEDDDEDFRPPGSYAAPPPRATLEAPVIEKPALHFTPTGRFNADYTLASFVVGAANELAFAAAEAIASAPARQYNPLFVVGGVGVGKTHLLHAIGHALQERCLEVLYVSAEDFTNDFVRAIKTKQTEAFRNHYRDAAALIIDDVQFIAGKESTQEELFHTFNALHNRNCQIILAADRRPRQIDALQDRLRSRFEWGLTVELSAPDIESRLHILQQKAAQQGADLPLPIAELIASRLRGSVRDLEGALNQVLAQSALTRQPLTRDYAEAILSDFFHVELNPRVRLGLEDILHATATYHQITLDDLLGKERSKHVATVRHIAIYMAREELDATLPEIGRALGGRSHSTILNSYNKVCEWIASDPTFDDNLRALRQYLQNLAS
ncbi:MAG: chromosomal replication initiator protein DnaA [Anaerolineae bacterium]|nr:chromosomal replication initiator protein DnaA [Anaerolineae bacterium]